MLVYFILGMLFIEIALPIIESLVSLVLAWIEVIKGKASMRISKMNQELNAGGSSVHAIGFTADFDEEEFEE